MTTQMPEYTPDEPEDGGIIEAEEKEKKRRRWLLVLLMSLSVMLCCTCGLFGRYLWQPEPLPELLPLPLEVNYSPHYLFSIYEVDQPVGVTLSPRGDRVYVAETGGERLVKIFNRNGDLLDSFAPPRTERLERSPVYMATDDRGRLFVVDRLQHAVFVYDHRGSYLDTILEPSLTLSEYVSKHVDGLQPGDMFAYDRFEPTVYYQKLGDFEQTLPAPDQAIWAPLGVRFDQTNKMLLTDVAQEGFNVIRQVPAEIIQAASWYEFNPPERTFGAYGEENGQFIFPNIATADSQGRVYVTDGNNGRISVWDGQGNFLFNFGRGVDDGSLNLPRGAVIDDRDRLYVVDAVGQNVKVYDVSEAEPEFLFAFGDLGAGDGQFNYPSDIALDASGRLYVADRENNRVQVWSY